MKDLPFSLQLAEPLQSLEKDGCLTLVNVGNSAAKSYLVSELFRRTSYESIFWASTDESAENIHLSAECFFSGNIVLLKETLEMEQYYEVLRDLDDEHRNLFIFEDFEKALTQPMPTSQEIESEMMTFLPETKIKIFEVFED